MKRGSDEEVRTHLMRNLDRERLLLDRERLELDKKKFAFEQRFLNRNFPAIVSLLIALAAGVLSRTQFQIASQNQAREIARLASQHDQDIADAKVRQDAEWKIKAGDSVAQHLDQVFSNDPMVHLRMVALIRVSFPDGVREEVLTAIERIVNPQQRSAYRVARRLETSAVQLANARPQQAWDRMNFSRSLQAALRTDVLDAYLQDLGRFQFNESIAALLVWSSIPISTSTNFDPGTSRILFNFDIDVFWSWQNPNLRRGFANNSQTLAAPSGRLAEIQSRLLDGGK